MRKLAILAILAAIGTVPSAAQSQADPFEARLLELQNGARIREKLPRHSSWKDRAGTGESLWIGTRGFFGPEDMIGGFLSEKRFFRPGTFPEVSSTGRWEDVGHYTQIIWPTTQAVGCALEQGKGNDVLVCRYWPAGNYFGNKVG